MAAAAIIKLSAMASKPDLGTHFRLNEAFGAYSSGTAEELVVGPLSLEIGSGEFVSVVGSGDRTRSLLLRMIAGLVPLQSGSIDFAGEDGSETRSIGFVFQDSVLLPWRNVLQNVTLEAEIRKLDRRSFEQRARCLLAAMGLPGIEDQPAHELKIGQAQRVAICRALLHNPPLLLIDDPFVHMDFAAREHFVVDFQRLWMESRFAVMLATGDISEAVQLSDRIVLMSPSPGRILQVLEIDLPRPRRLDKATTPQIAEYASLIRTIFRAQGLTY